MSHNSHAVVIGGGMAGLITARTLCDHFARVTLIERDALTPETLARKGVPQARHTHTLMTSGQFVLERLFPGFRSELEQRGAVTGDIGTRPFFLAGVRFAARESDMRLLGASRGLLESYTRERLREQRNLRILDQCDVLGLIGTAAAIRGVRIVRRQYNAGQQLAADLVVDTTGRGSKTPRWLEALGLAAPTEERIRLDVGYTTALYRRTPRQLGGMPSLVVGAKAPNPRAGIALAIEDDRWTVSLMGYIGHYPPTDHEGLLEFARALPVPDLYELMRASEPLGEPVQGRFPFTQRRRYERLRAFPDGLLVLGDALCSFNPIYAQGMSVAALQAELLDRCLRHFDARRCARPFFASAARIVDTPWKLTLGGDLRFDEIEAPRPLASRLTSAYMQRLIRAAAIDSEVAHAFQRVAQLLKPASSLFAPHLAARVFAGQLFADAADPAAVAVVERISQV